MTKTLRKLNRGQPLEFDNIATKTLIAKIIVYIERLNAFPLRLKKKAKIFALNITIQHSTGNSSQRHKTRI